MPSTRRDGGHVSAEARRLFLEIAEGPQARWLDNFGDLDVVTRGRQHWHPAAASSSIR